MTSQLLISSLCNATKWRNETRKSAVLSIKIEIYERRSGSFFPLFFALFAWVSLVGFPSPPSSVSITFHSNYRYANPRSAAKRSSARVKKNLWSLLGRERGEVSFAWCLCGVKILFYGVLSAVLKKDNDDGVAVLWVPFSLFSRFVCLFSSPFSFALCKWNREIIRGKAAQFRIRTTGWNQSMPQQRSYKACRPIMIDNC